jgi:hypothetical protein
MRRFAYAQKYPNNVLTDIKDSQEVNFTHSSVAINSFR